MTKALFCILFSSFFVFTQSQGRWKQPEGCPRGHAERPKMASPCPNIVGKCGHQWVLRCLVAFEEMNANELFVQLLEHAYLHSRKSDVHRRIRMSNLYLEWMRGRTLDDVSNASPSRSRLQYHWGICTVWLYLFTSMSFAHTCRYQ